MGDIANELKLLEAKKKKIKEVEVMTKAACDSSIAAIHAARNITT